MTSELSNALNPLVVQQRRRRSTYVQREQYVSVPAAAVQPRPEHPQPPAPAAYTRHRSELELAVVEPPPPPPRPPAQPPVPARQVNPLREIVRAIYANKQAAEQERNRRMAWEQEQEAKYLQRQAELEKQLADLQSEMSLIKTMMTMPPQQPYPPVEPQMLPGNDMMVDPDHLPFQPPLPAPAARIEEVAMQITPPPHDQDSYGHDWPVSPVNQSSSNAQPPLVPAFIEGSSTRLLNAPSPSVASNYSHLHSPSSIQSSSDAWMPSPSPVMLSPTARTGDSSTSMSPTASALGKRRTPPPLSPTAQSHIESSSDESDILPGGRRRRKNGHDNRCLTIQAAIRRHIYRCMQTDPNEPLPESYALGRQIVDGDPVRFVWEKTTRKSPHNAQMKKRVLDDLLANRKLYKHVPEKDFSEKTLDAGFDQAFTTMRQKFRTQQDETAAMHNRWREEQKALKARRKERKKSKLSTRKETRTRLPLYAHPTFDSALQLDCMSSEESESEYTASAPSGAVNRVAVLRVRGLPWRSTRLLRFFATLDAAAPPSPAMSPAPFPGEPQQKRRRGPTTIKERCVGPPKDGALVPPHGVSSWMVSRRWMRECELSGQTDVVDRVRELVDDAKDAGFDWETFGTLGGETDEEPVEEETQPYIPQSDTSYALANALQAPM